MLKVLNLNLKEDLIKHGLKNQIGEFYSNGKNTYMFHGIGCEFCNKLIKIDWDFGFGDNWCGIDPWKFYCFIKDNKKNIEKFHSVKLIKNEYEKAVLSGEMFKKSELYYFN